MRSFCFRKVTMFTGAINSMGKYRKKPISIDAIKHDSNHCHRTTDWVEQLTGESVLKTLLYSIDGRAIIKTLEGPITAQDGDYIIRGAAGEFYPCKPDIFEKTYEPVNDCTTSTTPG